MENEKEYYTSGQIEKMTGITKKALTNYEKMGLISPKRTGENVSNNRRLFTEDDIERLKRIVIIQAYGPKLKQIKEILDNDDADLIAVIQSQIDDLRRQQNHLQNLILFAKFVDITDTDFFEGLVAGPQDIDAFADMVRDSTIYSSCMNKLQNLTDDEIEAMFDELYDIIDDYLTLDGALGFRGIEEQIDRFCEWWSKNVYSMDEMGYLGFWAVFEDDALIPSMVEEAGEDMTSGNLEMAAFYVYMKRLMVHTQELVMQIALESDRDIVLAMSRVEDLRRMIARKMGAGDVSELEKDSLVLSVLDYMANILADKELVSYIDYSNEIDLHEESVEKTKKVVALMDDGTKQ